MTEFREDPFVVAVNEPLHSNNQTLPITPEQLEALMNEEYDPVHWGNCFCYWYKGGIPRIVIGPQCILHINLRGILYSS